MYTKHVVIWNDKTITILIWLHVCQLDCTFCSTQYTQYLIHIKRPVHTCDNHKSNHIHILCHPDWYPALHIVLFVSVLTCLLRRFLSSHLDVRCMDSFKSCSHKDHVYLDKLLNTVSCFHQDYFLSSKRSFENFSQWCVYWLRKLKISFSFDLNAIHLHCVRGCQSTWTGKINLNCTVFLCLNVFLVIVRLLLWSISTCDLVQSRDLSLSGPDKRVFFLGGQVWVFRFCQKHKVDSVSWPTMSR